MYDVIIVGAGPAGATLARHLPSTYRVLLVDRRTLSDRAETAPRRDKPCGGLISPDAQRLLAHMGIGLPQDLLVDPQVFAVRSIDWQSGIERYYQRHYINVDRGSFDRYLVSLVGSQVTIRGSTRVTRIEPGPAGARVELSTGSHRYSETCTVLAAADGANSFVRRQLLDCGSRQSGWYLAIQDTYRAEVLPPYFTVLFDPALTDFYSWAIPKNGTVLVGTAIKHGRGATDRHERAVAHLAASGYRLGARTSRRYASLERPRRRKDIRGGAGQTIFVGEAAGLISPSSAEGLSYAFASALTAADVLRRSLDNPAARYTRRLGDLRWNILAKNAKSLVMYTPGLRKLIMRCGISALAVRSSTAELRGASL